jgi:hypothetical protein
MRFLRTAALAAAISASITSLTALPARASTFEIDLTITLGGQASTLTGIYEFITVSPDVPFVFGGAITPLSISGPTSFSVALFPGDICFGQTSCSLGFDFSGSAGGIGPVQAAASISLITPDDPCFQGGLCDLSGLIGLRIFAGDRLIFFEAGTWEVTIPGATLAPTPLPGALPLFAAGWGAFALVGWRRKRKATRLAA